SAPRSILFPYTTLFRSDALVRLARLRVGLLDELRLRACAVRPIRARDYNHPARRVLASGARLRRLGARAAPHTRQQPAGLRQARDRKSTRLNSSHSQIS